MFDNLRQFAGLMTQMPKIKAEMERLEQRRGEITAEGDAGAGMVKVRVNGRLVVLSCVISPEALALNDREMLEDLIKAATNQALDKARQMMGEETAKLMGNMGLPSGLNLPGLG